MASKKELKALITLAGKVDPSLQTAMLKASGNLSKLGNTASKGFQIMKKAALLAGAGIAAGIGVGTVALGGLINKSIESADNLAKMRDKTGMTAEELQRLQYVSGQLGANFESIPQAISILTKQMDAARSGSKDTSAAFKALGIQITDGAGKLRPQSEVFQEALMQLTKVENQADRNALAFKLFGKGAAELFPLLNAGSGEIAKLVAQADKLGIVMSGNQVDALDKLGDSWDSLKASAMGFGNKIAAELMPKVQPIIDKLIENMPQIQEKAMELFGKAEEGISNIISKATQVYNFIKDKWGVIEPIIWGIVGAITAWKAITVGMKIYNGVMAAIQAGTVATALAQWGLNTAVLANPMTWIVLGIAAAIGVVIAGIVALWRNWDTVSAFFVETWGKISEAFKNAWSGVVEWFSGIWDGVKDIFKGIFNFFIDKINSIIGTVNKVTGILGKAIGINLTIPEIPRFAQGGFTDRPSIFGEAGPEAAIPLKYRNPRSISLLNQTARAIGSTVGGNGVPQINFNFNFNGPVSNKDQVIEGVMQSESRIKQAIDDYFAEKARVAYG